MKVFISYRRSDTQHAAGRLREYLDDTPGIDEVFFDVEEIEAGVDWKKEIERSLFKSDVCLVLIGDDWAGHTGECSPSRINEEGDLVRYECAEALKKGKKVIPILFDGAAMPSGESLPEDVRDLCSANGVFLRHASFKHDASLLVDKMFGRKPAKPLSRWFARHPLLSLILNTILGIVVATVLLVVCAIIFVEVLGLGSADQVFGGGVVQVFILLWLATGGVIGAWLGLRR